MNISIYHVSTRDMIYEIHDDDTHDTQWYNEDIWWYIMISCIENSLFLYRKFPQSQLEALSVSWTLHQLTCKWYIRIYTEIQNHDTCITLYLGRVMTRSYLRCKIHAGYMRDTCFMYLQGWSDTCGIHSPIGSMTIQLNNSQTGVCTDWGLINMKNIGRGTLDHSPLGSTLGWYLHLQPRL